MWPDQVLNPRPLTYESGTKQLNERYYFAFLVVTVKLLQGELLFTLLHSKQPKLYAPCHFSPLAEILGPIELLENCLTFEGVQWRKIIWCMEFWLS